MYSLDTYKPRVLDEKIDLYLSAFGAIALVGPRFCGKTTSGQAHSKSEISLADSSNNFTNRRLAQASPDAVLSGESPKLIDEWQEVPQIWDAVRYACDENNENGKFILTGSSLASVKSAEIFHSGTGRIATLTMNSMSLFETKDSSGILSLSSMFNTPVTATQVKKTSLDDIIRFCIRGGWPKSVDAPVDIAKLVPLQYIDKVIEEDIYSIPSISIKKDSKKVRTAVKILAKFESQAAGFADYSKELTNISDISIGRVAFSNYIDALTKLFVTYEQPAFELPASKTGSKLLKSEKLRFADPSLVVAALKYTKENLLGDMDALSRVFDCLCVHDLKIYAEKMDASIFHINEEHGITADCVIQLADDRVGIFKHVIAAVEIDKAIPHLAQIKKILTNAGIEVSLLCVICGLSDAIYTRSTNDGDTVVITPLTALAP